MQMAKIAQIKPARIRVERSDRTSVRPARGRNLHVGLCRLGFASLVAETRFQIHRCHRRDAREVDQMPARSAASQVESSRLRPLGSRHDCAGHVHALRLYGPRFECADRPMVPRRLPDELCQSSRSRRHQSGQQSQRWGDSYSPRHAWSALARELGLEQRIAGLNHLSPRRRQRMQQRHGACNVCGSFCVLPSIARCFTQLDRRLIIALSIWNFTARGLPYGEEIVTLL